MMSRVRTIPVHLRGRVVLALLALLAVGSTAATEPREATSETYLVQAANIESARGAVTDVGGEIETDLAIINAVGAVLSEQQVAELRARAGIRVYVNATVEIDGKKVREPKTRPFNDEPTEEPVDETAPSTEESVELSDDFLRSSSSNGTLEYEELARTLETINYDHPVTVSAPDVHKLGVVGRGITVAVIDTGLWWEANTILSKSPIVSIDVTGQSLFDDPNGHGTHVAGIIASNQYASNGIYEGIAPRADLAIVRAFRSDGSATYLDVINAIDTVVAEKDRYNIRVLNLSFSATPQSHYWDDPLNQAVMAAWEAGIVVVASAGNEGSEPMTVGVPGNLPYIITVGAMTDSYTPYDPSDDRLASFSSMGPTYEGFVKPDVVAPGGHITSSMPFDSYISLSHPDSMLSTERHFSMSGTSQATAVVSGIVALMLELDPELTPDDVKCRLMSSARPAIDDEGRLAYSILQQGAGLVNALDAVNATATGCANVGLDIAADLKGKRHFGGPVNQNENGEFYLMDADGAALESDELIGDSFIWSQGNIWSQGFIWSQGYIWSRSLPWSETPLFSSSLTETMCVNKWVEHE